MKGRKNVYVTDVKDAQKLLEGYGIHPEVADVPQESVFMTTFFSRVTSHRWAGDFPVSYDEPSDVRRRR